jgi:hypothetical protein
MTNSISATAAPPKVTGRTMTTPRRALAVAVAAAPVLLLAGTAAVPTAIGDRHGTDRTKALRLLLKAAPDRGHIPLALVLLVLGLGLLVPAAIGLIWLTGGRPLAVVGGTLVTVGAPMGVATNAVTAMTVYRLTDPALPRGSAVDVLAYNSGTAGEILFILYLLVLVGMILLGVSLWRSRALTWWQAALVGGGAVLGFAGPEGPAGSLFTIPLVIGMALAARKLGHAVERHEN